MRAQARHARLVAVTGGKRMTARQVAQFATAIIDGTQHDISGEDGRAAIEMCEAAIRSARTGHAMAIPLEVA